MVNSSAVLQASSLICSLLLAPAPTEDTRGSGGQPEANLPPSFDVSPAGTDPALFFGPRPTDLDLYRVGVEDVLRIRVFELEQLDVAVRVSGDGTIDLPLVGTMTVQGLTSAEVGTGIADRLRNVYLENPQVSVFVQEFHSRKLHVLGAVRRPDAYALVGPRNLLQVLAEAGGLTQESGAVLYVFRQTVEGGTARLSIPLSALHLKGDVRYNIWLLPGDIIDVPPEEVLRVSVLGAVRKPGVYELPVSDRPGLLNAIARAGGLSDLASKSGLTIIRRDASGAQTIVEVDLGDVLSGSRADVPLIEGDIITLKESFW